MQAILAEAGGAAVASANAGEKGATTRGLISDHLTGANDRTRCERWVPRWMAFPPAAYTERGGVPMVAAARRAKWMVGEEQTEQQASTAQSCSEARQGELEAKDAVSMPDHDPEGAELAT